MKEEEKGEKEEEGGGERGERGGEEEEERSWKRKDVCEYTWLIHVLYT